MDQNLSPRLASEIEIVHRGSAHVREFGLSTAGDEEIWEFAKREGFAILSKDADFHQMSFVYGPPPKVIWLRYGNCSTNRAIRGVLEQSLRLEIFDADPEAGFLVLSL